MGYCADGDRIVYDNEGEAIGCFYQPQPGDLVELIIILGVVVAFFTVVLVLARYLGRRANAKREQEAKHGR